MHTTLEAIVDLDALYSAALPHDIDDELCEKLRSYSGHDRFHATFMSIHTAVEKVCD